MKKIVYTRPDGGISIVHPVISSDDVGMTEEAAFNRAWGRLPVDAINPKMIDESEIPASREYRGAWEVVDEKIEINEVKRLAIVAARNRT